MKKKQNVYLFGFNLKFGMRKSVKIDLEWHCPELKTIEKKLRWECTHYPENLWENNFDLNPLECLWRFMI